MTRTDRLYLLGAFAGLSAALAAALNLAPANGGPSDVVAYVNGEAITAAEYARALSAMQAGLERPLTKDDKARALRILVDEELIVQEAIRLGLANSDRLVRKNIVQAVVGAPGRDAARDADEPTLRKFFEDNAGLFATPVMVTAKAAMLKGAEAGEKEAAFAAALRAGKSFDDAVAASGLDPVDLPPAAPPGKIADYLGAAARDAVLTMRPGDIAGPVNGAGGGLFVWLVNRTGEQASFEDAKEDVLREWRRRERERALEAYIDALRRRARVKIVGDPQADE